MLMSVDSGYATADLDDYDDPIVQEAMSNRNEMYGTSGHGGSSTDPAYGTGKEQAVVLSAIPMADYPDSLSSVRGGRRCGNTKGPPKPYTILRHKRHSWIC